MNAMGVAVRDSRIPLRIATPMREMAGITWIVSRTVSTCFVLLCIAGAFTAEGASTDPPAAASDPVLATHALGPQRRFLQQWMCAMDAPIENEGITISSAIGDLLRTSPGTEKTQILAWTAMAIWLHTPAEETDVLGQVDSVFLHVMGSLEVEVAADRIPISDALAILGLASKYPRSLTKRKVPHFSPLPAVLHVMPPIGAGMGYAGMPVNEVKDPIEQQTYLKKIKENEHNIRVNALQAFIVRHEAMASTRAREVASQIANKIGKPAPGTNPIGPIDILGE